MKAKARLIILTCIICLSWIGCGPSAPHAPLHQAVEKGDLKAVQQHIAFKTDLNKKNASGWTALHLAAMKGDLPIVKVLTQAGADATVPGKDGKTSIDVAREQGHTVIAKLLQERSQQSQQSQQKDPKEKTGRGLIDGGLGVGAAMDGM